VSGSFSPLLHAGHKTLEADTHVDSYDNVLSDAGSTPAASTINDRYKSSGSTETGYCIHRESTAARLSDGASSGPERRNIAGPISVSRSPPIFSSTQDRQNLREQGNWSKASPNPFSGILNRSVSSSAGSTSSINTSPDAKAALVNVVT